MADSDITFYTGLDNSQLEKDVKKAERSIESLKNSIEADEEQKTLIEKAMERNEAAIHDTERALASLKDRLAELDRMAASDPRSYIAARAEMDAAKSQMAALEKELEKQVKLQDDYGAKWQAANDKAEVHAERLAATEKRAEELGEAYKEAYKGSTGALAEGTAELEKRLGTFVSKMGTQLKRVFVFSVFYAAFSKLKSYLSDAVSENERLTASVQALRTVIDGFVAPVAAVVAGVLTRAVNAAAAMLMTLARLVDGLFHTDFGESIRRAQAAARSAQDASKATERQAKSAKKLAKATKEASRQLMAFDELNVMNAENSNAAADAADAQLPDAGLDDVSAPGWDGIEVGRLDAKLAEIMVILGAAIMAVGAILAFSGVNVPLGIALMAVGALMVYTAVQEQWGKLSAEIQDEISGLIGFLGSALLVIGIILVFASPATMAIGLGCMAAGALLLATAVGLQWGGMSDDVRAEVRSLMLFLGAALLVIGAILALTGAAAPLGVGLMIVGSVMLASSIALRWGSFSQQVKDQITDLMLAVGAALVVIGVVLIATGAGVPLGIGCILAGIGTMATAVALNWNYIVEKVKGVWERIRSWFQSSVAPKFTVRFWKDKFKSIANGLISALNSGLSGVEGFVNKVADGVSEVLGWLGVTGWSFNLSIPRIPALAEGAVIPPNRRFMAVLGDQSNGTNLEAPEGLIRQIVREESGNAAMLAVLQELLSAVREGHVLECDGYELARVVNDRNRIRANIYGV